MRNYLLACNNIFERGLLSNDRITAGDQSIIERIDDGYKYFEDWWESLTIGGASALSQQKKRDLYLGRPGIS